jgi:hypothetical protein
VVADAKHPPAPVQPRAFLLRRACPNELRPDEISGVEAPAEIRKISYLILSYLKISDKISYLIL